MQAPEEHAPDQFPSTAVMMSPAARAAGGGAPNVPGTNQDHVVGNLRS
jgi:hypothetical protein